MGRVRPDRDRFVLVGHSAGGNLSALLAAERVDGLPKAKAVIAITPGEVRPPRRPDLRHIPPETLLVVVANEHDFVVGDGRAREIFAGATAVPEARKRFVLYRTDRRGPIPLVADHLAPTAGLASLDSGEGPFRDIQMSRAGVDLLDRHGFWWLADLTLRPPSPAGPSTRSTPPPASLTLAAGATADPSSRRSLPPTWPSPPASIPPTASDSSPGTPMSSSSGLLSVAEIAQVRQPVQFRYGR